MDPHLLFREKEAGLNPNLAGPPCLDDEEESHDGEFNEDQDKWYSTDGPLYDGSSSEAGFDEEDVDAEYASLFDLCEVYYKEQ